MVVLKIENYISKQILIATCLNFGQVMVGYSLGWSSPVVAKLQDQEQTPLSDLISITQASWVGSMFSAGMVFGPQISGPLSNIIGRKPCLLLAGCINIVAQVILALATNLPMILSGRFICGLGMAIITVVNVIYIGEMASTNLRGIILTATGIFHVLGSLLVYAVGPFVSYAAISYSLMAIGAVHFACTLYIPDSPIYYLIKGDEKAALNVLTYLGRVEDFKALVENAKEYQENKSIWKELFTIRSNKKSVIITSTLIMFQLSSGILAVLFFATTIFQSAGSSIEPALATIIIGLTQFFGALIVPFVIDRAGRRTLLLVSSAGCFLSTAVMGIYFYLDKIGHHSIPSIGWLPLSTLILMLLSYSVGLNIIPNTLIGEMFRPNVRSVGSSIAMTCGSVMGFLSVTTFGYFVEAVGNDFTFWIFAGVNAISFLFIFICVPETKGKSLIEIEEMLSK